MKKEIINLINSTEGRYRLNNISFLYRWTENGMGKSVDCLRIEFDTLNGVCFSMSNCDIVARDYDGIITECQAKIDAYLSMVSAELCKNLRAGYRNKERM